MLGQFVEIQGSGRHLSLYRGFLQIRHREELLDRLPLDDLLALIITGPGCTFSSNLIEALTERNITFAICGSNYTPVAYLLPLVGNHVQSARMVAQSQASKPLCKRLWKRIVQAKIRHQAIVLDNCNASGGDALRSMSSRVRSGDVGNMEAQAARRYWPALLGERFRRNPDWTGPNALLNYAYAIVRSCVARAVSAAGLHPSIGLHHHGPTNPFCLVDDLMEPFRPLADYAVWQLLSQGHAEVTPEVKKALSALALVDMPTAQGMTPLFQCAVRQGTSLAQIFTGERRDHELELPGLAERVYPSLLDL